MFNSKNKYLILLLLFICRSLYAQQIPINIANAQIYSFIDELANDGAIEINSVVKPYSREEVLMLLKKASKTEKLTTRQRKEIKMYLKEFSVESSKIAKTNLNIAKKDSGFALSILPPLFQYHDSLGYVIIRPVYGSNFTKSTKQSFYSYTGGAEAMMGLGKHWGLYVSLCDNYYNKVLPATPSEFVQTQGCVYKLNVGGRSGGDYDNARGGIYYSWKWGHIGLAKDDIQWGDNYNGSNIFSGRVPSFPFLKLRLNPFKWLDFNYFHGWLVSEVIDSNASYKTSQYYRAVYRTKCIAANIYTIKPWKKLNVSFGNSIIYSDVGTQPAYFIPFLFFKAVDHTLMHGIDNQNSQMFFNIDSRNIKHLNLFYSCYIDEFSFSRVLDQYRRNFVCNKFGVRVNNWVIKNLGISAEYTYSYPLTYKHRVPSLTFESNQYNLGWWMRDNSKDLFISIDYKPLVGVVLSLSYDYSIHGNEYQYIDNISVDRHPFIGAKTWERKAIVLTATYNPIASFQMFANLTFSNITGFNADNESSQYYLDLFTTQYLQGKSNSLQVGFKYGF